VLTVTKPPFLKLSHAGQGFENRGQKPWPDWSRWVDKNLQALKGR